MTIWLDVTTTLGWGRPALGIVRVEAETARQFLNTSNASAPVIGFCRFDRAHGGYLEVGREEISSALARLDAGGTIVTPPMAAAPILEPAPISISGESREQRLPGLLARFPRRYQERMLKFALARKGTFHVFVRAYRESRAAAAVARRG